MNPLTPGLPGEVDQAAIAVHEMFLSFQRAGFTRREALELVKVQVAAATRSASSDGGEDGP